MNNTRHIILFDGVCNLCNTSVRLIIKIDKQDKFKFASLQSKAGRALLKEHNLPTDTYHSFVYIKGDKAFLKSSASLQMLREIGGVWAAFYALIVIPAPIRDFVYDIIAKSRYSIFGKRKECMIPTPELKERFLE